MRLFITKNLTDSEWLQDYCDERGWTLDAQALIRFELLPFHVPKMAQVIFFGSKNGVDFLCDRHSFSKTTAMACIGMETARKIEEKGYKVDFVGEKSGNPMDVANHFKTFLGNRKVYFPCSDQSKGSVERFIPNDQKIVQAVYSTLPILKNIKPADIHVFTSPSNVEAFFTSNELAEKSVIIAWGKTTENALHMRKQMIHTVLETSQKGELMEILDTIA